MSDQCVCDNNVILAVVVVNIALSLFKPFLYKAFHNKLFNNLIKSIESNINNENVLSDINQIKIEEKK